MPRKLEFHVVHASGEDDVHKAGDLNYHGPLAKGWQAARYCSIFVLSVDLLMRYLFFF